MKHGQVLLRICGDDDDVDGDDSADGDEDVDDYVRDDEMILLW